MHAGRHLASVSDELGQKRAHAPPRLGEPPLGQSQAELGVTAEQADQTFGVLGLQFQPDPTRTEVDPPAVSRRESGR